MRAFARIALVPLLLVPGDAASAAPRHDAATRFDALSFFAGHTEGRGRLKIVLRPARAVSVHGDGQRVGRETIALRQTVEDSGKPSKHREWRIREVAPGRYAGTLTDAIGPITGREIGGRLRLDYRLKGGLRVTQWIEAAPGGRIAHNRLTVRKLGIPVAHLDETIRKID